MTADRYNLRQVIELTGLSEFTLRGWENRYKAFSPRREPNGRRTYSRDEIERALLLRELTERGARIGEIARLPLSGLKGLVKAEGRAVTAPPGLYEDEIAEILSLVTQQKWAELKESLRAILKPSAADDVLTDFLGPLLSQMGAMVAQGILSISQEHIFSSLIRERLFVVHDGSRTATAEPRIVIATPEGDYHELGILTAHAMAGRRSCDSLYLGPNTPKADLCETVLRYRATHVLIASTVTKSEGAADDLLMYLNYLDRHLPPGVSLWAGGRNSVPPGTRFGRDFFAFSSLREYDAALRALSAKKKAKKKLKSGGR